MNAEVTEHPHTGLRHAARGLGAWFRQYVHGHLFGDNPWLLPVFLTTVLGASAEMVGLIEGVGEATASISKLFSSWFSDKLGNRKALTIVGYGLGALEAPLRPCAYGLVCPRRALLRPHWQRHRGAPRDALVGNMVPAGQRGAAYGLRQALDTVGAFAGPLCSRSP